MEDMPLQREDFDLCFPTLLEIYGKRDPKGFLADVFWNCLQSTQPTGTEFMEAIADICNSPPHNWVSPEDVKQLIREQRKQKQIALPPVRTLEPELSIDNVRRNRIAFFVGMYRSALKTGNFDVYHKMLANQGGAWTKLLDNAIAATGIDPREIPVSHDDVLAALGIEVA